MLRAATSTSLCISKLNTNYYSLIFFNIQFFFKKTLLLIGTNSSYSKKGVIYRANHYTIHKSIKKTLPILREYLRHLHSMKYGNTSKEASYNPIITLYGNWCRTRLDVMKWIPKIL